MVALPILIIVLCSCLAAASGGAADKDSTCVGPIDDAALCPARGNDHVMLQGRSGVVKGPSSIGDLSMDQIQWQVQSLKDLADRDARHLLQDGDQIDGEEAIYRSGDYVEYLQTIGRFADTNGDGRLSDEELVQFAKVLQDADRGQRTRESWRAVALEGVTDITMQDLVEKTPLPNSMLEDLRQRRFTAADRNGDGLLNYNEFHAYVHPLLDQRVFVVERNFHFDVFDTDDSSSIDFEEFKRGGRQQSEISGEEFSEEDAAEEFRLHDEDSDGVLSLVEFGAMLAGHATMADSIQEVIKKVDQDGDAHINLEAEVPVGIHHLLDSAFVEDYFFHKHWHHRGEL